MCLPGRLRCCASAVSSNPPIPVPTGEFAQHSSKLSLELVRAVALPVPLGPSSVSERPLTVSQKRPRPSRSRRRTCSHLSDLVVEARARLCRDLCLGATGLCWRTDSRLWRRESPICRHSPSGLHGWLRCAISVRFRGAIPPLPQHVGPLCTLSRRPRPIRAHGRVSQCRLRGQRGSGDRGACEVD